MSILNIVLFSLSTGIFLFKMFDDLIELLRKVAEGNSDALERSGMEEVTEGNSLSVKLSLRDLQAEHYRTSMVKACCENSWSRHNGASLPETHRYSQCLLPQVPQHHTSTYNF